MNGKLFSLGSLLYLQLGSLQLLALWNFENCLPPKQRNSNTIKFVLHCHLLSWLWDLLLETSRGAISKHFGLSGVGPVTQWRGKGTDFWADIVNNFCANPLNQQRPLVFISSQCVVSKCPNASNWGGIVWQREQLFHGMCWAILKTFRRFCLAL